MSKRRSLSSQWKSSRKEREALKYDEVADMIADGSLTIQGANPAKVHARMRGKAARARSGKRVRVYSRRR